MGQNEGTHMGWSDGKNNPETTNHAAFGTRKASCILAQSPGPGAEGASIWGRGDRMSGEKNRFERKWCWHKKMHFAVPILSPDPEGICTFKR